MHFRFQSSRWYDLIARSSSARRYGITCCVLVMVIAVWYIFMFNRLDAIVNGYHQADVQLHERAEQQHRDHVRCCTIRTDTEQQTTRLKNGVFSGDDDLFQSDIAHIMPPSITMQSYTPHQLRDKELYAVESAQIRFESDMEGIHAYMNALASRPHCIRCTECTITCIAPHMYSCTCVVKRIRLKKAF